LQIYNATLHLSLFVTPTAVQQPRRDAPPRQIGTAARDHSSMPTGIPIT